MRKIIHFSLISKLFYFSRWDCLEIEDRGHHVSFLLWNKGRVLHSKYLNPDSVVHCSKDTLKEERNSIISEFKKVRVCYLLVNKDRHKILVKGE